MRHLLAAAALASAVFTAPAHAAPACKHLITDVAGDVDPLGSPPVLDDQKLVDILAVDLKTDRKVLTVAVSVVDIDPEQASLLQHNFTVYFGSAGKRYGVHAVRGPDGDQFSIWVVDGQDYSDGGAWAWTEHLLGEVTGSFDALRNVVTVIAPLSLFRETGGLKGRLDQVHAISWTGAGTMEVSASGSDDFTDRVPGYTMGKPSCIR